jgi:hypothetical protein
MAVTRKCPRGKVYRKTFIRKGRRITGKCIRSQTRAGETTKNKTRRILGRMSRRMRGVSRMARGVQSCPSGFIMRKPYMRYTQKGKHVLVPAACIRDVGAAGKGLQGGPGIGPLRKGNLSKYGYSGVMAMSQEARRIALRKAVNTYGSLTVWRKLNALHVYTRRTSPKTSQVVKQDMDWVRTTFGVKAF